MMHNVVCIVALAFSNASVGINHALVHAIGARFRISYGWANALLLPHVVAYNASTLTKFMPSPHVQGYSAPKKYATVADLLELGGRIVLEKVGKLVKAIEDLLDRLEIPKSIAAFGIPRQDFEVAIPDLVKVVFDDSSWCSTNSRMLLMGELVGLLWVAYEGRGRVEVA